MLERIDKELFADGFISFAIYAISILIVTMIIATVIKKFQKYIQKKYTPTRITAYKYAFKTIRAIIYILASFAILSEIKPMKSLGTGILGATSVIAVIVGLAAQESFGNYISGFFLAMYEPFHIGDFISLPEKNISGVVKEINFRHIVIESVNCSNIIIPNSMMNNAVIEDRSAQHYKNKIYVSVTYDSDFEKAKKIIKGIVSEIETKYGIKDRDCLVFTENLNESGIDIAFFVEGKSVADSYMIACEVRGEIVTRFKENGIGIAYPTQTIYVNKEE